MQKKKKITCFLYSSKYIREGVGGWRQAQKFIDVLYVSRIIEASVARKGYKVVKEAVDPAPTLLPLRQSALPTYLSIFSSRFEGPVARDSWEGVREAVDPSPACPQGRPLKQFSGEDVTKMSPQRTISSPIPWLQTIKVLAVQNKFSRNFEQLLFKFKRKNMVKTFLGCLPHPPSSAKVALYLSGVRSAGHLPHHPSQHHRHG